VSAPAPTPADAIVMTGVGMVSALGPDATTALAAMRAGVARFAEWEGYLPDAMPPGGWEGDSDGLVTTAAPLPYVDEDGEDDGGGRDRALLRLALQDLVRGARLGRAAFAEAGLFVALPEATRPGWAGAADFVQRLFAGGQIPRPAFVEAVEAGHAGGLIALAKASAALAEGRVPRCVVAGVESALDAAFCAALDADGRLKHEASANGRVPGEEASAVLLEPLAGAAERGARVLAALGPVGTSRDVPREDGAPSDGAALTAAVRSACGTDGAPLRWVAADLNGERGRAREWGLVAVRLRDLLGEVPHLWHPADCRGDVGAASAVSLLAAGARAFGRGYAPADRCLIWSASDGGERAAVMLTAPRDVANQRSEEAAVRWA
jgi:3-oxoacyl-[acyl-carrier-protein] synthase-1